jgi:ubiquinone/menaquinone biosynthesis C-methylase UbiE
MSVLTPARRRGIEILDDPATPPAARARSMADLPRSNALFGGARIVRRALADVWPALPRRATLLDVGTGLGDLAAAAKGWARDAGIELTTVGCDISPALLVDAGARLDAATAGDALHLPFGDASVDVVVCSQLLHHFEDADAQRVVAELHRVARHGGVIGELRRSWFAAAGFWSASFALRFDPITRHDGVVSVLRGFTTGELARIVHDATGVTPIVRRGAFWRVSAAWRVTTQAVSGR